MTVYYVVLGYSCSGATYISDIIFKDKNKAIEYMNLQQKECDAKKEITKSALDYWSHKIKELVCEDA